jgi:uncharacterized Rmd1/YagE family protein
MPPIHSIPVLAFDIATSFDLTALRPNAEKWGKVVERRPLIIEFKQSQYIVVFEYGSVIFFNFTHEEARSWLEQLKNYANRTNRREFSDNFTLYIGEKRPTVSTEELSVNKFFTDTVKLVAIVLSRSVGLEYYEDLIDRNLAKLEESVEKLSREGRLVLTRRDYVKEAGLALAIHHELAYNLQLLDDPDVIWEHGTEMQKLYEHLSSLFSISKRAQAVERKLNIIARSSEFIIERLQDRTVNIMELAIIGLFVLDVILIFFELLK